MQRDAWQLAVMHKLNLENLTTLAQLEVLNALEPYRGLPPAEVLPFISREILKIVKPFEELGRRLSVDYFEQQHQLAIANPMTPVQSMEPLVATALSVDTLNNRGKGITQAVRAENNPALRSPVIEEVFDYFPELPQSSPLEDFQELPEPDPTPEPPKPARKPRPINPPQTVLKEKVKAIASDIRADIKADRPIDFDKIGERVAEATQAQLFEDDRDNLDYYADLEKTIVAVKRIPSSGGCAWCKSAALFMDGDSKSHKYCKCTTGYIYEGEDEDKFMDDEQRKFRDDYEKAQEALKSGETKGRLLKNGTPEKETAMKRQIKEAAWAQKDEVEKAEADRLGRKLLVKEKKALHRDRRKKSEALAKKMNNGEPLSLEDKQTLHGFGLSVEEVRAPKFGQTQRNEDVLAVLRRENGYR